MTEPARAVLSEAIQEAIDGRRIATLVLLTFRFDPGFFEEEVLPIFFDIPASHSPTVRLLQLEDVLKTAGTRIAVYYDPRGLMGNRSARLDFRRIPVRHRTGYFHPKNILVLVERDSEEEGGQPERALIVCTISANLTEDGWWRNVEVCHIEEVKLGEKCGFRGDLVALARRLRQVAPPGTDHTALEEIREFLQDIEAYETRSSVGRLHPRLYVGDDAVVDFLSEACGPRLDSLNLEVVSPYFDKSGDSKPLLDLVEKFHPAEVRVLLPRADDGTALCSKPFYRGIRQIPNCTWGRLAPDLLRMGKAEGVALRRIHAKVYRFFGTRPHYEALFVGSVNLTRAAHGRGGNLETAFLVENEPPATDWWLSVDRKEPAAFAPELEGDQTERSSAVALALRYHWDKGRGWALWDGDDRSPDLIVEAQGSRLFGLTALMPGDWRQLPPKHAAALAAVLPGTSFVQARIKGQEPVTILVQEEGLSHKPSLLMTLSAAEILRSWALLTIEQRTAFIEERLRRHPEVIRELGIMEPPPTETVPENFFDRFAGVFHGFGCLRRAIAAALESGRESEAVHRLFGRKYDSLVTLLERILSSDAQEDDVTRYVTLLCARQVLSLARRDWPEFLAGHPHDVAELERRLQQIGEMRNRLGILPLKERDAFLAWFERWFLTPEEMEGLPR